MRVDVVDVCIGFNFGIPAVYAKTRSIFNLGATACCDGQPFREGMHPGSCGNWFGFVIFAAIMRAIAAAFAVSCTSSFCRGVPLTHGVPCCRDHLGFKVIAVRAITATFAIGGTGSFCCGVPLTHGVPCCGDNLGFKVIAVRAITATFAIGGTGSFCCGVPRAHGMPCCRDHIGFKVIAVRAITAAFAISCTGSFCCGVPLTHGMLVGSFVTAGSIGIAWVWIVRLGILGFCIIRSFRFGIVGLFFITGSFFSAIADGVLAEEWVENVGITIKKKQRCRRNDEYYQNRYKYLFHCLYPFQ